MKTVSGNLLILFLFSAFLLNGSSVQEDFGDILNIKNTPTKSKDWKSFFFTDKGSWFGFALPDKKEFYGSFTGPFFLTHGRWLSSCSAKLKLLVDGKVLDLGSFKRRNITYYPGRLFQQFVSEGFSFTAELIFTSSNDSLLKVSFRNCKNISVKVKAFWEGDLLLEKSSYSSSGGKVEVNTHKKGVNFRIDFLNEGSIKLGKDSKTYSYAVVDENLEAGDTMELLVHQQMDVEKNAGSLFTRDFKNSERFFKENRKRWEGYLNNILETETLWGTREEYRRVAVKCLMTLINNWRSPRGDLLHNGVTPSCGVSYFSNGLWGWDSWKHAVALVNFEPELAKEQIRVMFDYQNEDGFIADCIYPDKKENNWLNTKPPLIGWSVWKVFEKTGDKAFLREVKDKVLKFHRWWYIFRDHDKNGLCEYGATKNKLVGAKWESGMDDGLRFDQGKMVYNRPDAWSIDQESVDLNSYLYGDKIYLSKILNELGDFKGAEKYLKEAKLLKDKIRSSMFDSQTGFFYDIKLADKSFIKVMGPEGWIPLWTGVATQKQAQAVKISMLNEDKFNTYVPFPTIPKDNPKFMTGYWRGPVWIDQAYFGIKALEFYGYKDEAQFFTMQLFNNPEGLKNSDKPIRENYNPINGKGMKVNHFSWSAAHFLLLFMGK